MGIKFVVAFFNCNFAENSIREVNLFRNRNIEVINKLPQTSLLSCTHLLSYFTQNHKWSISQLF